MLSLEFTGREQDGIRLFLVISSYRTIGNGHKIKYRILCLNIRKPNKTQPFCL